MAASKQPSHKSTLMTKKETKSIRSVRRQRFAGLIAAFILLAATALVSLMVGAKPLPPVTVIEAVFSPAGTFDHTIVQEERLPRTLVAMAAGPAFGLSGALIQSLTRNPLADPGILGVNAGASFAVAMAVGVFSVTSMTGYLWFAFAGALAATVAVYVISGGAGKKSPSPVQITLSGVALGAVLSGVTTALTLMNTDAFSNMLNWSVGNLADRSLNDLLLILPFLFIGVILSLTIAHALNAIAFGDDRAASLGVRVSLIRIIGLIAITLLAGGATAIAGPIGFIGLMVPHCVRWFVGPDQPWIFIYSLLVAPVLLLLSDIIGRIIMFPAEIPVGIITGFVGAPILLILVRRRKASGL